MAVAAEGRARWTLEQGAGNRKGGPFGRAAFKIALVRFERQIDLHLSFWIEITQVHDGKEGRADG